MYVNLTHPDFAPNKRMLEGTPADDQISVKPAGSPSLAVPDPDFKGSSESLASDANGSKYSTLVLEKQKISTKIKLNGLTASFLNPALHVN